MKKVLKKLLVKILILSVITLNTSTVYSQNLEVNESCFEDWQYFISSQLSYNEFREFWNDIFDRYMKNLCHYQDIRQVINQQEALSEQIKEAYLSCNAEQAIELEEKYDELRAELFYLRNFIEIPVSDIQKIPDDKVYGLMRSEFVLNSVVFTEKELKPLFDSFTEKYKNKISTKYAKCKDPNFEALKERWDSFVENIKALSTEQPQPSVNANWGRAISTPHKAIEDFVGGIKNQRLNNLPAVKTPDEVVNELYKESEKTGGAEPTIADIQSAVMKTAREYVKKAESASLRAEYEAKYKKGNDAVTSEYERKIQEIIDIAESTFDPFNKLKKCSKSAGERQCQ